MRHDKLGRIYALTRKFNRALEDIITNDKYSHFMKIDIPADAALFDDWGRLSSRGRIQYWLDLDTQFGAFDRGKVNLKPCRQSKQ